jgi:hypothetical protein
MRSAFTSLIDAEPSRTDPLARDYLRVRRKPYPAPAGRLTMIRFHCVPIAVSRNSHG